MSALFYICKEWPKDSQKIDEDRSCEFHIRKAAAIDVEG